MDGVVYAPAHAAAAHYTPAFLWRRRSAAYTVRAVNGYAHPHTLALHNSAPLPAPTLSLTPLHTTTLTLPTCRLRKRLANDAVHTSLVTRRYAPRLYGKRRRRTLCERHAFLNISPNRVVKGENSILWHLLDLNRKDCLKRRRRNVYIMHRARKMLAYVGTACLPHAIYTQSQQTGAALAGLTLPCSTYTYHTTASTTTTFLPYLTFHTLPTPTYRRSGGRSKCRRTLCSLRAFAALRR